VGFELTISAGERPKTYALDRAATGTGWNYILHVAKCTYDFRVFLIKCLITFRMVRSIDVNTLRCFVWLRTLSVVQYKEVIHKINFSPEVVVEATSICFYQFEGCSITTTAASQSIACEPQISMCCRLPCYTNSTSASHCSLFTYFHAWIILVPKIEALNKTIVFSTSQDELVCSRRVVKGVEDKHHKSSIIFYWIGSHPVVGRERGKRWEAD